MCDKEIVLLTFHSTLITCQILSCCYNICNRERPSWSWSYGCWIYNYMYLCNQCLSPLKLRVRIPPIARLYLIQHYVIKFVSDLRQVDGFLKVQCIMVFSNNKTDCHDITEILLKVALITITLTPIKYNQSSKLDFRIYWPENFKIRIFI